MGKGGRHSNLLLEFACREYEGFKKEGGIYL